MAHDSHDVAPGSAGCDHGCSHHSYGAEASCASNLGHGGGLPLPTPALIYSAVASVDYRALPPIDLHPHQVRAMDMLRDALRRGRRRPVLMAPTGFGKTVVGAAIIRGLRERSKRVAFSAPSVSLIDQTVSRFEQFGIPADEIGVMQADHPRTNPRAPIQICSAQTLARRALPDVDYLLIDEVHVRFDIYDQWMDARKDLPVIGLSATPWSKGLGKRFDDLLIPTSVQELIDTGYLSPFRVFAPSAPDLEGIKTVAGDYHEGQLGERCNNPTLVADIVSTWTEKGRGLPTLCFAVNREHAKALADQFERPGIRTAYCDAFTGRQERVQIGERLGARDLDVVVNIGTLTTGVDWDVRCIILARPTKSKMLFAQIIGRGLRTAPGKDDCLILDHSDTHHRLGFVTDPDFAQTWLDDGTKASTERKKKEAKEERERTPLPKACPDCAAVVPARETKCGCGHVFARSTVIEAADGALEEIKAGAKKYQNLTLGQQIAQMPTYEVLEQLRWIQLERDRSVGWIAMSFNEIYGRWPKADLDNLAKMEPSPLVQSWVRWRDIKFAKGRARARNRA